MVWFAASPFATLSCEATHGSLNHSFVAEYWGAQKIWSAGREENVFYTDTGLLTVCLWGTIRRTVTELRFVLRGLWTLYLNVWRPACSR